MLPGMWPCSLAGLFSISGYLATSIFMVGLEAVGSSQTSVACYCCIRRHTP